MVGSSTLHTGLRHRVKCPHCWTDFATEDVLWVSSNTDLIGDKRLGPEAQARFLPSRFTITGNAIDIRGSECQELACPNCHLIVPRPCLELRPFFVSIAGTPSCGKSYFLASMTWQLRSCMPKDFECLFRDADPLSNKILNDYEEQQFLNHDQDKIVRLAKTQEFGDFYSTVMFENQVISLPKPFLFSVSPGTRHPASGKYPSPARLILLYDNAGESFQAGKDTVENPVTRHLAHARTLIFCYDPTQDPRVRKACQGKSSDPQIADASVTARQETVFHEIVTRIRRHSTLQEGEKSKYPLIIACTKYDAWWNLLGEQRLKEPFRRISNRSQKALDLRRITSVSETLRALLAEFSPELVAAAESFSQNVLYVPVSATGVTPIKDPVSGLYGVRPKDISPMWCGVPLLTALAKYSGGLIPYVNVRD